MQEEKYQFTAAAKKNLIITLAVGVVLTVLGAVFGGKGGHHEDHETSHETTTVHHEAKKGHTSHAVEDHSNHHAETKEHHQSNEHVDAHVIEDHGGGHEEPGILARIKVNLWLNNIYFAGLAVIGLFFVAIQYAAQAGWSAGIKRIPLAMASWLPIAGILTIVLFFFVKDAVFHWTHTDLYHEGSSHFDSIINGKKGYFFFPLHEHPGFPVFYLARMVIFFGLWYLFFIWIKKEILNEDVQGGTDSWYKTRRLSAIFLVIFAFSSSIGAWDWVMSIDTHWFSTMFGWYIFASWWVSGLALITFIVVRLKDKGYLSIVNANHLHDLGKFVFAFSIFWTYIWFSQFMLIYYANIPEETIYYYERWLGSSHYSPIFFANLIINFFFPFLVLMTRDSKRHGRFLKVVCPVVIFGHWLDFYLMMMPGTLKDASAFGFLEIGMILIFLSAFVYVTFNALSKAPLFAKNHPMLEESLHHHI